MDVSPLVDAIHALNARIDDPGCSHALFGALNQCSREELETVLPTDTIRQELRLFVSDTLCVFANHAMLVEEGCALLCAIGSEKEAREAAAVHQLAPLLELLLIENEDDARTTEAVVSAQSYLFS